MLQVFLCIDEDNNRILAVKEVDIDPNMTKNTRQVHVYVLYMYII